MSYIQNIIQLKNVPHTPRLDPIPNYLIFSKGKNDSLSEAEVFDLLGQSAATFVASGTDTMEFGRLITRFEVGKYLLSVTYPSMGDIENIFTALSSNATFNQLSSGISINMRSSMRLRGMV